MSLFEQLYPNASDEDRARHKTMVAELREHAGQRPCPDCGCTEFYDDREPEKVTGGFGIAGCACDRCNGVDSASLSSGDTTP